jgi:hypothetical protein
MAQELDARGLPITKGADSHTARALAVMRPEFSDALSLRSLGTVAPPLPSRSTELQFSTTLATFDLTTEDDLMVVLGGHDVSFVFLA